MASEVITSIEDQDLIQKRRRQIVEAATDLFGRHSYNDTTMKQISKQAGFSYGLIYSYVQTKEDVLFLVLQNIIEGYRHEIPEALEGVKDPIERFSRAVRAYCRVVEENAAATLLAYRATKDLSSERKAEIKRMENETNQYLANCIQECVDAGYFREIDVHLTTYQIVMLAHGWALKGWAFKTSTDFDDYVSKLVDLFLHGVLTEVGWKHLGEKKGRSSRAR